MHETLKAVVKLAKAAFNRFNGCKELSNLTSETQYSLTSGNNEWEIPPPHVAFWNLFANSNQRIQWEWNVEMSPELINKTPSSDSKQQILQIQASQF